MSTAALGGKDHLAATVAMRQTSSYPNSASGQPPWVPDVDYLEPLTTLAYLAARTRRARVGTSVLVVPLRPPLVVAKMLASLDVLSGGRLIVGVGTGWLAEEFEALGVPFARRGVRTDEYLRALKECWTSDAPRFEGEFVRFADVSMNPKPLQKPHPPIWIGGHGPRVLRRLLAESKREPESVTIAVKLPLKFGRAPGDRPLMTGTSGQIADDLRRYRSAGVDHFALDFLATEATEMHETVERFAQDVRPQIE